MSKRKGDPGAPVSHSINRYVPWEQVISLLKVSKNPGILPHSVICPKCKIEPVTGTLIKDHLLGGAWFHCIKCKYSGDIVEYAATHWSIDSKDAIDRLVANGVNIPAERVSSESLVNAYLQSHVNRRKNFHSFWEHSSRANLLDEPEWRELGGKLGFRYASGERWRNGLGRFVGGCLIKNANELYKTDEISKRITSPLYTGTQHRHILCLPAHDKPGSIFGFGFLDYDEFSTKLAYKSIISIGTRDKNCAGQETGLFMYEAIETGDKSISDKLFVIGDPVTALRFHARHFVNNDSTLPLIGSITNDPKLKTRSAYQELIGRKIIFWAPYLTPELFSQAALVNGDIYQTGLKATYHPDEHFNHLKPTEWLKRFESYARSWRDLLQKHVDSLPPDKAEEFIKDLDIPHDDMAKLVASCSPKMKQRIELAKGVSFGNKWVRIDDQIIIERDDKWIRDKNKEVICDAIMRITNVISHPTKRKRFYEGFIRFKGEEIKFFEEDKIMENGTGNWMKKTLLDNQAGLLNYSRNWSEQLLHIAIQLSTPKMTKLIDRFGWNEEQAAFVFPTFSVSGTTGEVLDNQFLIKLKYGPGLRLKSLEPVPSDFASLTQVTDELKIFWATFASIVSSALVSSQKRPATNIALVGHGAQVVGGTASRYCGSEEYLLPAKTGGHGGLSVSEFLANTHTAVSQHDWPILVAKSKPLRGEALSSWLEDERCAGCIFKLTRPQALACQLVGDWIAIEQHKYLTLPAELSEPAQKTVAAYLSRLGKNRLILESGEIGPKYLLDDIAKWVKESGGERKVIDAAKSLISTSRGTPKAQLFLELIAVLIEEEKIRIKPTKADDTTVYRLKDNSVFLPMETFYDALSTCQAPAVDDHTITKAFTEINKDLKVSMIDRIRGWILKID